MRRYFRLDDAESVYGEGSWYVEYDGEWATRQVERYGERWFSSREDYHAGLGPGLTDRPLSENLQEGILDPDNEITAAEFEAVWEQSGRAG